MHLLFVGDTHGTQHLGKLKNLLPEVDITGRDAIIHCGDIGVAWMSEEDEALDWWRSLQCRVLVCLGNHENFDWVMRQPVETRFGCRGWALGGNLFAPLPGQTARLGGRTFWFYPGGYSVDFPFRRPGFSIYREELLPKALSGSIMQAVLRKKHIDYVISHDGPRQFVLEHLGIPLGEPRSGYWDLMQEEAGSRAHPAFALDALYQRPELYGQWYFGHHHRDIAVHNIRCLWDKAVLEDTLTGAVDVIDLT